MKNMNIKGPILTDTQQILSQLILYISLIVFIKFSYNNKLVETDHNTVMTWTAVIFGIISMIIAFFHFTKQPIMSVIIFLSTALIIYSIIRNVKDSPLPEHDEEGNPITDLSAERLRLENIDFYDEYKDRLVTKTFIMLGLYSVIIFICWWALWKNNPTSSDILSNQLFVFTMSYMAFALFILLDMFKNVGTWNFDILPEERNEKLLDIEFVSYSALYITYLVYVLVIAQAIRNTIYGTTLDSNFNIVGGFSIIIIIVQFSHYIKLIKMREECNCTGSKINVLNNNIKVWQLNNIILPILIIFIALIGPIKGRK